MKPSMSEYIAASLLIILLGVTWYYDHKVSKLEVELSDTKTLLVACKASKNALVKAIETRNNFIKQMAIDEVEKEKAAKEELIRLNKIISELGKVKSNDCKDIKNTLDVIRDYDYDKL